MSETTVKPLSKQTILAWTRLMRSSQGLLASIESALKNKKLPPLCWYDVLLELERESPEGLRPFELQKRLLLAQYNLSRLIDRMESEGHIKRKNCHDDGRGQIILITRQGRKLMRKIWPVYQSVLTAHFADRLSKADTEKLTNLLGKLL
jgi:DNA-binding MarR family transcriptional regulator